MRNGKRTTGRLYRARVKLTGDNKVRDISLGVSDKQVAQQKLNKLIQELEHESAGLIPAKAEREAAQSPLLDLVSEYVNELTVLGRSADHLRHVRTRGCAGWCGNVGWTRLADVTPASFQSWRKEQTTKAPKTLNEYLATLSAFWTWLRKQSRVSVNPFELVERTDTRGKERIQRRALSDAQSSSCCKWRARINWPICCPCMRVCGGMKSRRCAGRIWCLASPADCCAFMPP
jgi:hypothetical protein